MSAFGGPDIITNGLVAYLDSYNTQSYDSGIYWNDLIGNYDGSINYATFTDNAFYFNNNSSDNITIPTINIQNGNATFSMFVKPITMNDFNHTNLVSNKLGGPVSLGLGVYNNHIYLRNYSTSWTASSGSIYIPNNSWVHLSWVNFNDYSMKMYVNGIQDGSTYFSKTSNGGPLNVIGYSYANHSFHGYISSFQYYNRSLSSKEILYNYNSLKSRYGL